ncbi:hypothetical protein L1987_77602 [Smallanthus sonchifolius]|uniref:Uncharacterized protein n=1 Tax=Smallanthus sonchifolius TaxID=185202 RepID=A0ACB8Z9H1_9ASTR|nr:hypothetical protein L1987_77602 [Smallanthus sonchifolius]
MRKLEPKNEGIRDLYQCLEKGYNSMPLDLPRTPFNKATKARKDLNEKLRKVIEKRDAENTCEGLLGALLSNAVEGKMKMILSLITDR